jgi:hypothetical protein
MLEKVLPRALILGVLIAGSASAEEFTLRFRPEVGAAFEVLQEMQQNTAMEMGPAGSQQMESEMRMETSQRVLDPAESGAHRIEFVFDRMTMSMTQGGQQMMSVDTSDEEQDNPQFGAFSAMVGQAYVVEIDDLGAVTGMEGLDEMLAAAAESTGNAQIQTILEQAFSEDTMLQTMQMSMPAFPEEAVAVGDSWNRQMEMSIPMLGTLQVDATYLVEGLSEYEGEPCVRLGAEMAMEFDLNSPMLEQMAASFGNQADIQMEADDAEASGWMCIARSDGVTLESEIENQLSMSVAIAMQGQPAMQMQMAINQVTRQTVER